MLINVLHQPGVQPLLDRTLRFLERYPDVREGLLAEIRAELGGGGAQPALLTVGSG